MSFNVFRSQKIFERFYQTNPYPTTELIYHTAFELLVAVILSAQATDKAVNRVTQTLFKKANTPQSMLSLGEIELKTYIKSINLYPRKAKYIIQTSTMLSQRYNDQVPDERKALESLSGVGRKTANIILNLIFDQPTIAVDTHIFRVCNRTGLAKGHTPKVVEKLLLEVVPLKYRRQAHHWLLLHGRYVCKARRPSCKTCLISDLCDLNQASLEKA